MKYRLDIEGLRAIAVVAVVAFHVGLPGWQGGFAGVDVFFVISGFLIGSLLLEEISANGKISFTSFYARRARRILPAMAVVVGVTIIAAAFLLNPLEQQKSTMQQAAASILFVANIFFWKTTGGYFDAGAEAMPLLHMWSLGVEEQWYLVFPLLLVGLIKWSSVNGKGRGDRHQNKVLLAFALLLVASFIVCVLATEYRPRAAFFLLPTRAWEFLAGVCTAMLLRKGYRPNALQAQLLSLLGLCGLALSIMMLEEGHGFPGAVAALPVFATCLLLIAGAQMGSLASITLTVSPLRWLGRVSYSWYLWHWPLLIFARALNPNKEVALLLDVTFGALLSLFLAALTYRYVEQPMRHPNPDGLLAKSVATLFAAGALLSLLLVASFVGWGYASKVESRKEYAQLVDAVRGNKNSDYKKCMGKFVNAVPEKLPRSGCIFGSKTEEPRVMLWADSHGNHFSALLDPIARDSGVAFLLRALGGCAPVVGIMLIEPEPKGDIICTNFVRAVYQEIERGDIKDLEAVILVGHWSIALSDEIGESSEESDLYLSSKSSLKRTAALKVVEARLNALAEILDGRNIRLMLVDPSPIMPHSVPQCLARRNATDCGVSRARVEKSSADMRALFARLAQKHKNIRIWDPLQHLCDKKDCPATRNNIVLYSDKHHVSQRGALSLKEPFRREAWPWLMGREVKE